MNYRQYRFAQSRRHRADHPQPGCPDLTYATRIGSNLSRNLTTAQLRTVYTDPAPCLQNYRPLLPTPGSATRTAFLAQLGISEAQVGSCVSSQNAAGQPVAETTARR